MSRRSSSSARGSFMEPSERCDTLGVPRTASNRKKVLAVAGIPHRTAAWQ